LSTRTPSTNNYVRIIPAFADNRETREEEKEKKERGEGRKMHGGGLFSNL